jgi:uncharacterized protein (TIGR00251 family)
MVARDGLRVAIRLSPGAKADRLVAIAVDSAGRRAVRASVTAPAEDGKANEALLQLLARAWGLSRRDLSIVIGATSRNKSVRMAGDPQQLIDRITPAIAGLPGW